MGNCVNSMLTIKLSVGQRIALGYMIAVGIAVSGTVAGFSIGNYYHRQASEHEKHVRSEFELLHRLQRNILQARTHQQQLIPLLKYPQRHSEEYTNLLGHQVAINNSWAKLKAFLKMNPVSAEDVHLEEIPKFLQTYHQIPQQYFEGLQNRRQQIQRLNLNSPKDMIKAQNILLEFSDSELAIKFDSISDDLEKMLQTAEEEDDKAAQLFQRSSRIAQKIVLSSVALSVALSIILAVVTSQSIACPIQTLTQVAKRSTQEYNFNLQVDIARDDEIGVLGNSFNQLITTVKNLLQEQQTANKQLIDSNEILAIRNAEIKEKNIQLEEILAELKRTQLKMVQSEKMSTLGEMVAGIAREINNPVSFIHGNLIYVQEYTKHLLSFVALYQKYYPEPVSEIVTAAENIEIEFIKEDFPKILDSIQIGTKRITNIVLSLRNFSRLDESEFKVVDIHEGIDNTLLILQHRLKETPERPPIQIVKNYGNLPLIDCYPGQLNQVFMNILANAIYALETNKINQKNSQITITTSVKDEKWVQIAIADNGTGIPKDIQTQIFQPFFTTKPSGKGTGLGMSISQQIITEKHGGKIDLRSNIGEGTEFIIQIPASQNLPINNSNCN